MRISNISVFKASIPYIDDPLSEWTEEWGVQLYVKVELDGEFKGWGETLVAGSGIISAYEGVLTDLIIPYLEGKEISSISKTMELLNKLLFSAGLCGVVTGALSSVNMALWHAYSNMHKMKIYELLGGKARDSVPVYASFPRYKNKEDVLKAVKNAIERSFDFIKIHQPPHQVLETIKYIRENLGYDVKIAIDLNSPFDLKSALDFANMISRYEVEWIEEPLWPPYDYENLSKLTEKSPVPIAAGENEYSLKNFEELINSGVTYIQPDISKIGGVEQFLSVIEIARLNNVKVMPHLRPHRSAIALYHTLQIAAVKEDIVRVEFPLAPLPEDVFKIDLKVKNGKVNIPENIEINEEVLNNKYPFKKGIRVLKFSDLESREQ
ncbi:MAG: mandelate racemase/muconate lactonizing enzyme family protein [Sulfolobaceae archaeon]|nr:mandelate racemase/muconate lactonizing enzyme family protein [Sulfolobaceae archaeon]